MKTTIFLTFLLMSCVSHAIVDDYCVGDPTLPKGPAGYSCKDPSTVTIDDFVYTGLRAAGPIDTIFNSSVNAAFVDQFLGLNGLGLSIARLDLAVGGVVPVHTHRTSEIEIVAAGEILVGFIDTNDTAYYKVLRPGDVVIFPESLLHFQVNVGETPGMLFAVLNSANPGVQVLDRAFFEGNLPAKITQKIMLLDSEQVIKLGKLFGKTTSDYYFDE